jgi:hypothetical protein
MGGGYGKLIVESVLTLFADALKVIFQWINLPQVPSNIQTVIDQFFEYLRSGMGFVYIFFDMSLVKILLPLLIAVINFDKVYKLVMFVLRKIPFLGVD